MYMYTMICLRTARTALAHPHYFIRNASQVPGLTYLQTECTLDVEKSLSKQAIVLDGAGLARKIRAEIFDRVQKRQAQNPLFRPGLAVVQVGNQPDSTSYIRMKLQAASEAGFHFQHHHFDESLNEDQLLAQIALLNRDPQVHGLIVQLPLPAQMCKTRVCGSIDPGKDVDGLHPNNQSQLLASRDPRSLMGLRNIPCTPRGILAIIQHYFSSHDPARVQPGQAQEEGEELVPDLSGLNVTIVGRSQIVGRPVSLLLEKLNATVSLCHSKTQPMQLRQLTGLADILIVAAGSPNLIHGDWVKDGAIVITVGMTHFADVSRKTGYRLVGDVDFETAKRRARFITPVPGGVGPLTVAMLLQNTYQNALFQMGQNLTLE